MIYSQTQTHKHTHTFEGDPVALPLAPCCQLHLLVLLVHQEVLDGECASLAHRALGGTEERRVRLVDGAERAAAPLIAPRRAGLLQGIARLPRANVQLMAEVLVDAQEGVPPASAAASTAAATASSSSTATAAPAVAAGKHRAAGRRVDGERG